MNEPDDVDQQDVYFAERIAFGNTVYDDVIEPDELIGIANRLFATDWWERAGIPVPIIEPTGAKDTTSHASIYRGVKIDPVIRLAPADINARVLAHEAAHVAQFHFYSPSHRMVEDHGREFRATYLAVAEIVLGRVAADSLRITFAERVRVRSTSSLIIVPRPNPDHDPEGVGLYPSWRLDKHLDDLPVSR